VATAVDGIYNPVRPEDLKLVQGQSGRGLQFVCSCGCINWNHIEIVESIWQCRNCGRVFTHTYPLLVKAFFALEKATAETETPASTPAS
jgi:ribosomal protein L37AE/L43A